MRILTRPLPALATLALAACAGPAPSSPAVVPAVIAPDAMRALATPLSGSRTAEGGFIDAFAYAEKPGDVTLGRITVTSGAAHASGEIEPRRGSTWGGIGLTTSIARGAHTVDISAARALVVALAANGTPTLRVRLVGANTATRDSGCYPVAVVHVTPELRDYTLPVASFAPETFCPPNAPGGVATASALAAVEVADATVVPGRKREVDFTVGAIRVAP
jgi:hypothetical protein